MKILIVYQYFGTPNGSWSTRIYELTKRWVDSGNHVTVITSPYDKSDIKAHGLISRQKVDGIDLIVIDSGDSNRFNRFKRAYRALRFAVFSAFFALTESAEVIISSSGPITVAIPGILRKFIRRTPFVFEVRDLWPLGGIVMGKIKNPLVQKLLLKFEHLTYEYANAVVTCSVGQKDNIVKRLGFENKIHVISNASDNDLFGCHRDLTQDQWNIVDGKPYVLHLGSLGYIHNCSYLIEVARYIPEIPMVFIGDGAERKSLENKSNDYHLRNVYFLGQMPKKETVPWLSNCELSLFSTLDNEIQDTSSPNKIFDSFAAEKPIIQTTRGWIYDLVSKEGCGLNADPQDPQDFAKKIKGYFELEEIEKEKFSGAAKKVSQFQFNRDILATDYFKILTHVSS